MYRYIYMAYLYIYVYYIYLNAPFARILFSENAFHWKVFLFKNPFSKDDI